MSVESVYNEIKGILLRIRKDIVVNPGSVVSDIFLSPTAYIINKNRVLLDYVTALQTLYTIQLLLNDDAALQEIADVELKTIDDVKNDISNFIDKIALNYDITRYPATASTGTIYMGRPERFTTDINIPGGTRVKTLDNKEYATDTTTTMYSPGDTYYDPESGTFAIPLPITATSTGTATNTVSGTITRFIDQVAGLSVVYNKDGLTNGTDAESDTALMARIRTKLAGHNFGTTTGYKNLILNNFPNVKDVLVVNSGTLKSDGTLLMTRDNGYGGVVDIYVLVEEAPVSVLQDFDTFTVMSPSGEFGFYLINDVVGVSDPSYEPFASLDSTFSNPPNMNVAVDTGNLKGSYAEKTYVYFDLGFEPPLTPIVQIKYKYYPSIATIQAFLQLPENAILGNTLKRDNAIEDIALVKKAVERLINISMKVKILQGYDISTVKASLENNINNYIANLKLDEDLAQSDIVGIAETTEGVDNVILPLDVFNFVTNPLPLLSPTAQVNLLPVDKNEYIRLGIISIVV